MKTDNKLCFALSLAQKAGKLASGNQGVWDTLKKKGRARYVLIAADASPRTVEKIRHWCDTEKIPYGMALDRIRLGSAIGKAPRAAVVLLDDGFRKMMGL